MHKQTKKFQKGSTNFGVAGATTITGEKPDHQRKRGINKKITTRKVWVATKRDVNDS